MRMDELVEKIRTLGATVVLLTANDYHAATGRKVGGTGAAGEIAGASIFITNDTPTMFLRRLG